MESFFLELKSICKSYKFLVLILILFLFQLVFIQQAMEESKKVEVTKLADITGGISLAENMKDMVEGWWRSGVIAASSEEYEESLEFYRYRVISAKKGYESYLEGDWSKFHLSEAEWRLLYWEYMFQNITPRPEQYFGGDWEKIIDKLGCPSFKVHPAVTTKTVPDGAAPIMFNGTLYLDLARTGLPPTGSNDTSPWAYLFNFLRRGLPGILGAIVLLLTVNILHRERNFGAIKAALSAPRSRIRYLLRKLLLGFTASISVIALPQLLSFLILGIKHGFHGLSYPVLLDRYVLSNFTVFPDRTISKWFYNVELSKIPSGFDPSRLEFFDTIPLWQFFGLAAVQVLLFILFCTVLGLLISILVKNEVFAHIIAAATFVAGSAFGNIFPKLSTTAWDLFSKADVVPLLEGSLASTYLSSIFSLTAAIVLLFTASAVIFKKQDIVSN